MDNNQILEELIELTDQLPDGKIVLDDGQGNITWLVQSFEIKVN